jgi:hypothetical protein
MVRAFGLNEPLPAAFSSVTGVTYGSASQILVPLIELTRSV